MHLQSPSVPTSLSFSCYMHYICLKQIHDAHTGNAARSVGRSHNKEARDAQRSVVQPKTEVQFETGFLTRRVLADNQS